MVFFRRPRLRPPDTAQVPSIRLAILTVALLAGVVAVVRAATTEQGCPPVAVSDDLELALERRADNALIADASIRLPEAGSVYLEYGNDRLGWLRTPATASASSHRLPIVRLRPATTYEVRAFAMGSSGCPSAASRAEFTTGELPSHFSKLWLEAADRPSWPLTVTDVRLTEGQSRARSEVRAFVAFDQEGQPVWYHSQPRQAMRGSRTNRLYSPVQLANGNLVYLIGDLGVEEITPDGRLVRRVQIESARPHHDLIVLDEQRLLVLGIEERTIDYSRVGGRPNQLVRGDALLLVDVESGKYQRVWSTFDALDPTEAAPRSGSSDDDGEEDDDFDWTHSNSLYIGPRGKLVISVRWLNQIISLSPDLKTVEWKLGGVDSSFSFPDPSDRFYAPHSASELPSGNILLFDNGNGRPEESYSRALELALDFDAMSARKVWEYRHQPDLYSNQLSNATRLPSGNTLVNFGFPSDPDGPVVIVDAKPDGSAAAAMAVRVRGQRHSSYRANAFQTLAGELSVEPTRLRPG
jgi:hypothetical protein